MTAAAWVMLAGTAIAYAGLMTRFAGQVYRDGDADRRTRLVQAHPLKWRLHNGFFAAGALVVAVGFALLEWRGVHGAAALAGASGGLLGTLFALRRLSTPAAQWFHSTSGARTFTMYSVLTIAAFALLGLASLATTLWLGVFLLAWNALLVGIALSLRDLPPFLHYVGAIVYGVASVV